MFSNARTIVRFAGLDIRIDPSWLLIAALITWSLWQHVFPQALPGAAPNTYAVMAVLAMLIFFASLLLHEMAHALTGRRFGVETRRITLFLFGGVAELEEEPKRAIHEFWIALAGPAMSLVLAAGFSLLAETAASTGSAGAVVEVLRYLALINFVLAVFNLMPAFPLDGGRVLRAWLWHRGGDVLKATETAARVGSVLAYTLMGLGLLSLFQGAMVSGLWQIMLGMFVLAAGRGSVESQRFKTLLGSRTVADLMTRDPVVTSPQVTLADLVDHVMLRERVSFIPVMERGVLLGHMDSAVLNGIDRENWTNTQVGDVYVALSDDTIVPSRMPVTDLFERIAESGQRKFLVVDERRLAGVITTADLTRYLALVQELGRRAGYAESRRAQH